MLRPGPFVDAELTVGAFPDGGLDDWVASRLAHWPESERTRAGGGGRGSAQDLLDTQRRTCLVHSDLNPKNVLVDPDTLEVTGVLDWEFAHAGHPWTDLGNLLRFERDPSYVGGRPRGLDDPARGSGRRAARRGAGGRPLGARRPRLPRAGQPRGRPGRDAPQGRRAGR